MAQKVVVYARFSSDMQRKESADDQVRNVTERLREIGISTEGLLVLKDEAQSGTKSDREQFQLLVEMINAGEVAVLAVDDQSRLSRSNNVSALVQDLIYNGGRFISTSEGIDTANKGSQLIIKVNEIHNTATIGNLSEGVRRGQQGRVLDDGSAGDFPFGYESYYIDPNWSQHVGGRGPKPKKGIRILEEEAKWVRNVFNWFAIEHWSIVAIARELTRLGVSKGRKSKPNG